MEMLIERERSCLLLVDVQGKLLSAMTGSEELVRNCAILLKAARRLAVPVLVSEQYPKGLGPTVAALAALIPGGAVPGDAVPGGAVPSGAVPGGAVVEKTHFSCAEVPAYLARLAEFDRPQAVITGIEAHVCVLQTALGLKARGHDVFVVADAVASRTVRNHDAAMARLRAEGIGVVTTEMVLFEWLGCAGTPEFKELSALIR